MTKQRYWNCSDKTNKEFLDVIDPVTKAPVHISTLEIGKPAYLLLPNGDRIQTSPVQEWSLYGGTRIVTETRTYYAR